MSVNIQKQKQTFLLDPRQRVTGCESQGDDVLIEQLLLMWFCHSRMQRLLRFDGEEIPRASLHRSSARLPLRSARQSLIERSVRKDAVACLVGAATRLPL